ncbi:MAG: ClpXP protease specificity-enhancing factor [Pseudomonadota bacterium]
MNKNAPLPMTSNRPYLIRAFYEWILDNGLTPHLLVDGTLQGISVPPSYVKDGQIVFNISPSAVRTLDIQNDGIYFNARFGGIPTNIFFPPIAVLGIFARENGVGMLFPEDETADPSPAPPKDPGPSKPTRARPVLRRVK